VRRTCPVFALRITSAGPVKIKDHPYACSTGVMREKQATAAMRRVVCLYFVASAAENEKPSSSSSTTTATSRRLRRHNRGQRPLPAERSFSPSSCTLLATPTGRPTDSRVCVSAVHQRVCVCVCVCVCVLIPRHNICFLPPAAPVCNVVRSPETTTNNKNIAPSLG